MAMWTWLRKLLPAGPRPEVAGGEFVRPYGKWYEFPVVYLENDRFDRTAPRWLAFTAGIAAKQGPDLAPAAVQPYSYPTVFDGGGASRAEAWCSLRDRLLEVIAVERGPALAQWYVQFHPERWRARGGEQ